MKGILTFRHLTIEFEIPDEWLANTVLRDWLHESRAAIAYRSMRPPYPSDPQDGRIPQVEPSIVPLKAIGPRRIGFYQTALRSSPRTVYSEFLRHFGAMSHFRQSIPLMIQRAHTGLRCSTAYTVTSVLLPLDSNTSRS